MQPGLLKTVLTPEPAFTLEVPWPAITREYGRTMGERRSKAVPRGRQSTRRHRHQTATASPKHHLPKKNWPLYADSKNSSGEIELSLQAERLMDSWSRRKPLPEMELPASRLAAPSPNGHRA